MFAAPLTDEPGVAPGPSDEGTDQCGRLLGLVRRIIGYGRDLVASLQRQNAPTPSVEVGRCFGTLNLALIIARITRGLAIAARLEARLLRWPPMREARLANPDHPATSPQPDRTRPRPVRPKTARPPALSRADDDAALLAGLPSAEEIAARIRGRAVGEVIVEICRDLGIDATHELWREIRDAIIAYGGSLAKMLNHWLARDVVVPAMSDDRLASYRTAWDRLVAEGTGPP